MPKLPHEEGYERNHPKPHEEIVEWLQAIHERIGKIEEAIRRQG